jgi:hypothetical protein
MTAVLISADVDYASLPVGEYLIDPETSGRAMAYAPPIAVPRGRSNLPDASQRHPAPHFSRADIGDQNFQRQGRQYPAGPQSASASLPLDDPTLNTLAATVDDLETLRKALANRIRILTADTPDTDGVTRGFGLDDSHHSVAALKGSLAQAEGAEDIAVKALEQTMRAHPIGAWAAATAGVGLKTGARLLAAVHDPYWNDLHERPRTVGELFAFCGVAGPGYRKAKGRQANWSAVARVRCYIIAEGMVKNRASAYRSVYDAGRERYAETVHGEPCARCGPKGKPAAEGSPLSLAHQHARAMRLVMREILRDLWAAARDIHQAAS